MFPKILKQKIWVEWIFKWNHNLGNDWWFSNNYANWRRFNGWVISGGGLLWLSLVQSSYWCLLFAGTFTLHSITARYTAPSTPASLHGLFSHDHRTHRETRYTFCPRILVLSHVFPCRYLLYRCPALGTWSYLWYISDSSGWVTCGFFVSRFNFEDGTPPTNFDTFPAAILTVFQVKKLYKEFNSWIKLFLKLFLPFDLAFFLAFESSVHWACIDISTGQRCLQWPHSIGYFIQVLGPPHSIVHHEHESECMQQLDVHHSKDQPWGK